MPSTQRLPSDIDDAADLPRTARTPVDTPPPADYRFSLSLRSALSGSPEAAAAAMPQVGDRVLGFTLVEELGRGAFARVYLARQEALGGRAVALKVSLRPTREAEKLARLQHTNVVPVYSVHDAPPAQFICMPFLGRRTIADELRAFRHEHPSGVRSGVRSGLRSTAAVRGNTTAVSTPAPLEHSGRYTQPILPTPAGEPPLVGNVDAVLRVLTRLAAGLAHAHARSILHLDIKPANVLLADDGEPMLLDFNLSFDTAAPGREFVGGTVQYMAPEQLLDVKTHGKGGVDPRTDLYSLGVLAYEMLTGAPPFPISSRRIADYDDLLAARRAPLAPMRERNPAVSPAVEAIVRKLLAPEPADRYHSADDLRTDLERHLSDRPLAFAPDRSVRERFRKWRRRNPGALVRFASAALVGLLLGSAVVAQRQAAARVEAQAVEQARTARAGLNGLRLDLLLPEEPTGRERGLGRAEQLLKLYGLPDDAEWQAREAVARLPAAERAELTADLGEVLLLVAQTRWQDAAAGPEGDRQAAAAAALKLNRLARDCFPHDDVPPMLVRQYLELASAAGEKVEVCGGDEKKDEPEEPRTARGHFLDGVWLTTAGRFKAAIEPLEQAIAAKPDHAAAQFLLAYCRLQLGQHAQARERFDAARVLLPADPRPCYYRGLAFGRERQPDRAEAEFTRAVKLDPNFGLAYKDRALARHRLGKLKDAEADLTAALEQGAPVFQVRTLRAYIRTALKDVTGAAEDRKALRDMTPAGETDYLTRGWSRKDTDPAAALADFEAAVRLNPRSLPGLLNQAHVLGDLLKEHQKALAVVTRAAGLFPEYAPARAAKAVALARAGRRDEALREVEPVRQMSAEPTVTYQLACVYAQTAKVQPADRDRALALLRQALRDGYRDIANVVRDPDLDPVRNSPDFAEIVRSAKALAR